MDAPTPSIPLLKLPLLVFQDVIGEMSFSEKLSLSLCSKKTNCLVKSLRIPLPELSLRQEPYKSYDTMTIAIPNLPLISFQSFSDLRAQKALKICQISGITAKIDTNDSSHWLVYFDDLAIGLRIFLDYFYKLFEQNFHRISISPRFIPIIMNSLEAHQRVPLKYGTILYGSLDAFDLQIIFTNFPSDHLEIEGNLPGLVLNNTIPRPFKNLSFYFGEFLRLKDVFNFGESCEEIEIVRSRFCVYDVGKLLKHWLDGGMKALKFFKIRFRITGDIERLFREMHRSVVDLEERTYIGYQKTPWRFPAGPGLQRNDGTRASIHLDTWLRFAVWSDN